MDLLEEVQLLSGVPDKHQWRFSASGQYSSKSAYEALFIGAVHFEPWELIWKSWAPKKCQFFIWLAVHKRSWTADRLARRGLAHPTCCVLCDQVEEDIQHIIIGCVFAKQVWFQMLSKVGLSVLAPQAADTSFEDWWIKVDKLAPTVFRKGINSLIILGAWMIWKQRNDCVFNGASPNVQRILTHIEEEAHLWCLAGARELAWLPVANG